MSTETHTVNIVRRQERTRSGSTFVTVTREEQAGPVRVRVTGILVVFGMPKLLTGAIIAHECTHAYLRMSGVRSDRLTAREEEGLCELMAAKYLEYQQAKVRSHSQLRSACNGLDVHGRPAGGHTGMGPCRKGMCRMYIALAAKPGHTRRTTYHL